MSNAFTVKSAKDAALRAKGAPVSYELVINEEQRIALRALVHANELSSAKDPALEYWVEMLDALPADEAANPGILHGFCL